MLSSCGSDKPTGSAATPAAAVDTNAAPTVGTVSPSTGQGREQTFQISVSHAGGAAAVGDIQLFVGSSLGETKTGCWIDLTANLNIVTTRADDDSSWQKGLKVGDTNSISNNRCAIAASQIKVERNGNDVVASLPVVFSKAMHGDLGAWVIASGTQKHSGWQKRGTWTVN